LCKQGDTLKTPENVVVIFLDGKTLKCFEVPKKKKIKVEKESLCKVNKPNSETLKIQENKRYKKD
jgi:chaperone required for assembly of F1-ATPase